MSAARAPESERLKGIDALIVEDDFLIFLGLELTLNDAGAKVVGHCRTVSEARAFIASQPATSRERFISVLDVRLDSETSLPLARELQERKIPFLFYSGQGDWRAIQADFPDVPLLSKPIDPNALVDAVRGLTERRRSRRKP